MKRLSQRMLVVIALVSATLVAGLFVALVASRERSRDDLERAFTQRASISASMIDSIFSTIVESTDEQDRKAFGARVVSESAVRRKVDMPGGAVAVVGGDQRVLAAWPHAFGRRGRPIASEYAPSVRKVLDGRAWATYVDGRTRQVSTMTALDAPSGRRVVITTYPLGLINAFLSGYLERVRPDGGNAFLLAESNVLLSRAEGALTAPFPRVPKRGSGSFELGGEDLFYASAPIASTDWSIAVTVPRSELYAPVSGLAEWLGWGLAIGLTLMTLMVLALLRRIGRASDSLAAANADLEARNAEVVAADRTKTDFLATMSHELRTPLNGIIGFAELMHDGRVGAVSDQHREYLGDILASASHLRQLIDDVLDLSKIEAGKMELRPERIDPQSVIDEVCHAMRSIAVRKQIELRCEVDPELGSVDLDPGKFKQVLYNYLSNALKFTPVGGHVTVEAMRESDNRFRLTVEDDGPGIEDADMDRLWAAFSQLETGAARRHGGTGLGLSLTRRLVEAQGGEVGVDSTPGAGSRFYAVLPCVNDGDRLVTA